MRGNERDEDMAQSQELLAPEVRGPVEAQRKTPEDPPNPPLKDDVPQLSSPVPLERIQADNRLKQAGAKGLLAVADYLLDPRAKPAQLIEAVRFVASADFANLDTDQTATVREALAHCLSHEDGKVRLQAARALQVHGPGAQRTVFLTGIGDSERRVRWAVVRRFSDHPDELDKAQRLILLSYLESDSRADFTAADTDHDGKLTKREFKGTEDRFDRLDTDHDGAVSAEEWASPFPSEIRADVFALLLRMHSKLTPNEKPEGYNPWLPSADQLDIVTDWKQWNDRVSEKPDTGGNK
ncbi:MAG: hypothetical protein KDB82_15280 [Planctomycetes bacterium]|nr:hypothetical protein [Planctomycetota bacterium]